MRRAVQPARGADDLADAGLAVRKLAATALEDILQRGVALDQFIEGDAAIAGLDSRDRGFLMALVLTALRRKGEADAVIDKFLDKPLPRKSGNARMLLLLGATQLLFLDVPAHAAIDSAVHLARLDPHATHFSGLVNAVLRKIAAGGKLLLQTVDAARVNTPEWLRSRWRQAYGKVEAKAIAAAHGLEPPLDISVKADAERWAEWLHGEVLPTGSIRLPPGHGAVDQLPGYDKGEWWVQDAAAAMPVLLFGSLSGKSALDLCAAPGGKTLQMCAAGATVTAVDASPQRLQRLGENLKRTRQQSEIIVSDIMRLKLPHQFDAVLLDAPCSATGTIRRHPDLPYLKSAGQIGELADLQRTMLARCASFVQPGGMLVYCTCSLEPEECELQVEHFLKGNADFELVPVAAGEAGIEAHFIDARRQLRTLPHMRIGASQTLDGFFAARLRRKGITPPALDWRR